MINVDYPHLLNHIQFYITPGRRSESASFLMWYLENYYRLDPEEAIDSVCDQNGDKGIDGIYLNESQGTIDVFQSKITQNPAKTLGDTSLKEFYGSLSQLATKEGIESLHSNSGAQLAGLITRLSLSNKIQSYKVRGIFVTNINLDDNGRLFLAERPDMTVVSKDVLEETFISSTKQTPENNVAEFDISGIEMSTYYADAETVTFIAPLKSTELVLMPGIADQSIFDYNVRGPLGNTNVNKGIVSSIKKPELHKQFPLFHNGITIVSNEAVVEGESLKIETFYVVNGCQSLTALYKNRELLSSDLRILTKIIKVPVDSMLSSQITEYSNSQNGVKPRDFKSYNPIQVRLQNEFSKIYAGQFHFEIKRGEATPQNSIVISNEEAGILLMSFDLKQPWATHRKYQVFEDLYSDLFARPEVNADRIVMLKIIDMAIVAKIETITNLAVARYALTRALIMYFIRSIFENDNFGHAILMNPTNFVRSSVDREDFLHCVNRIIDEIIVDINMEFESLGDDFDYKSRLRESGWVKSLSNTVVGAYLKLVKTKRTQSLSDEWALRIAERQA